MTQLRIKLTQKANKQLELLQVAKAKETGKKLNKSDLVNDLLENYQISDATPKNHTSPINDELDQRFKKIENNLEMVMEKLKVSKEKILVTNNTQQCDENIDPSLILPEYRDLPEIGKGKGNETQIVHVTAVLELLDKKVSKAHIGKKMFGITDAKMARDKIGKILKSKAAKDLKAVGK